MLLGVLLIDTLLLGAVEARAQTPRPFALGGGAGGVQTQALQFARGIPRNAVATLETRGDSLWIGPLLSLTTDGGQTFQIADTDSVLRDGGNLLFSLDIEKETMWAGLGAGTLGGEVAAGGFIASRDGGQTFDFRDVPLDTGAPEDRVVFYGVSALLAVPVIRPEGSAPFGIDFDPATGTVWTAGRLSGIRRSTDGGRTWQRVVLPPDSLSSIRPDSLYRFTVAPATTAGGFLNYVGFSVLVDETGTVWAGTVAGVNRSRPEDVFVFETEGGERFTERAWQRFDAANSSLAADQVVVLEEQPLPGVRNPVWMAALVPAVEGTEAQQEGLTVTPDGGQTFRTTLLGRRVNDLAFRGDTVYAAADEGLFISADAGQTWREVHPSLPDRFVAPDLRILAVAATPGALWAGTREGLFKSTDEGQTWQVFRADVPLDPETPTERVPRVETYAYPNPFAPSEAPSGRVRIVVDASDAQEVDVEIYDAGMMLVQSLKGECPGGGRCEVDWDGTDRSGLRVANGVYFYKVDAGGDGAARGKILVME